LVSLGATRQGEVWLGRARHGKAGTLKQHLAGQGAARQGEARQGEDLETSQGQARRGGALQGEAGFGGAGQGFKTTPGRAGQGKARQGMARQGTARTFLHWRQTMDLSKLELTLGTRIEVLECELLLNMERGQDVERFAVAMLGLMDAVRKELKRRHNRDITVRVVKHGIEVLNDREAAEYNPKRYKDGLKIARRAHRRLLSVNVAALTPKERVEHDKTIGRQAQQLSMLRRVTDDLPVQPVERDRPRLFKKT